MRSTLDLVAKPVLQFLIKALIAFAVAFVGCFFFAKTIYDVLTWPFVRVAGPENSKFIYTGLLEYFAVQLKLAIFGGAFISFPIIAAQLYVFVASDPYRHERQAFLPYLVATPILFFLGSLLAYFVAGPLLARFLLGMQQGHLAIELLPRVESYLVLMMKLIFAFGVASQLPIVLTLLGRAGLLTSQYLRTKRYFLIVIAFIIAAAIAYNVNSQLDFTLPLLSSLILFLVVFLPIGLLLVLLYEGAIYSVHVLQNRRLEQ